MDSDRDAVPVADRDELRALGVVHDHPAAEPAPEVGADERRDLVLPRAAGEAGGDEDRLLVERDACALELGDRARDCVHPRIVLRARERQCGRLDDERGRPAARRELLQRRARDREAERVAHGCVDVGDSLAR